MYKLELDLKTWNPIELTCLTSSNFVLWQHVVAGQVHSTRPRSWCSPKLVPNQCAKVFTYPRTLSVTWKWHSSQIINYVKASSKTIFWNLFIGVLPLLIDIAQFLFIIMYLFFVDWSCVQTRRHLLLCKQCHFWIGGLCAQTLNSLTNNIYFS